MWKRFLLSVVLFGFLGISTFPDIADAGRRDGLSNSELIADKDDIFTYPQLAVDYANMLSFEYGATANQGNTLALYGNDSFAFGLALHRGDKFGMPGLTQGLTGLNLQSGPAAFDFGLTRSYPYPTPNPSAGANQSTPIGAVPFPGGGGGGGGNQLQLQTHTVFDLIGGFDLGSGKVGGRLAFGTGGQSQDPPSDDGGDQGEMYFLLKGGYTGNFTPDLKVDTALSILYNTADQNSLQSGDDQVTGSSFGFGLEGRANYAMSDTFAIGGLADLSYTSASVTVDASDDEPAGELSNFGFQLGAGPVVHVLGESEETSDRSDSDMSDEMEAEENEETEKVEKEESFEQSAKIATYMVVGHKNVSFDPNSENEDDEQSISSLLLPGFHVAGEFHLFEWLYFRSGAQYWFQSTSSTQATGNGDNDQGADGSTFSWSTGIGVKVGQFEFDGALNRTFMRNGPFLISGASSSPLFTTASAKYTW